MRARVERTPRRGRAYSRRPGSPRALLRSSFNRTTLLPQTRLDIVQHVHEVDVAIVWAFVGAEVFVHVAVRPELGAHVVEVVAGGDSPPVVEELLVPLFLERAFELIELVQRIGLHGVAQPGG